MALFPLMGPGLNVVASNRLYGGTVTQFSQTIKRFGWSAKFVDFDDLDAVGGDRRGHPRVFCEASPIRAAISPIDAGHGRHRRCGGHSADRGQHFRHPLSVPPDRAWRDAGGAFDDQIPDRQRHRHRRLRGRFGQVRLVGLRQVPVAFAPEPAYHGLKFHETFGPLAFTFHGIAIGLRDLGMTMNPQAAHYTLMGIETLSLRMERHVRQRRQAVANGWRTTRASPT
jgi:O-acetylhomoserine (thiol)-lyase